VEENYRILGWLLTHLDIPAATAEKARDLVMERWQLALTARRLTNLSPGRNRNIYRLARAADAQTARRFARQLLARTNKKIRRWLKMT
jgi:hypothetical protein